MAKKKSKIVDLHGKPRQEAEPVTPPPVETKSIEEKGFEVAADWIKVIGNLSKDGEDSAVAMSMFLQRIGVLQVLGEELLGAVVGLSGQATRIDSMLSFMMLRQGRPVITGENEEAFATMYEEWQRGWNKFHDKQVALAKQAAEGEAKNEEADDGKEHGKKD